ncbi:MAG: 50S ribosomal protein L13e [Promethearchaeati archaeon SRVP18_Atabeyarchaeia-1]
MSEENSGKTRTPMVKPPLGKPREGVLRPGRGFSYGEIDEAGASVDDMKSAHLRVDHLRKSVHEENVKTLQEALGTKGRARSTQKAKPKEKAKAPNAKKQRKK